MSFKSWTNNVIWYLKKCFFWEFVYIFQRGTNVVLYKLQLQCKALGGSTNLTHLIIQAVVKNSRSVVESSLLVSIGWSGLRWCATSVSADGGNCRFNGAVLALANRLKRLQYTLNLNLQRKFYRPWRKLPIMIRLRLIKPLRSFSLSLT